MIQVWISQAVLAEYQEVSSRPRIGISPTRAKILLSELESISRFVTPSKVVTSSPDPDDNMFLECAEAAKAHYLVTGNIRHFPERWKYTKRVTPKQFLDLFGTSPERFAASNPQRPQRLPLGDSVRARRDHHY